MFSRFFSWMWRRRKVEQPSRPPNVESCVCCGHPGPFDFTNNLEMDSSLGAFCMRYWVVLTITCRKCGAVYGPHSIAVTHVRGFPIPFGETEREQFKRVMREGGM